MERFLTLLFILPCRPYVSRIGSDPLILYLVVALWRTPSFEIPFWSCILYTGLFSQKCVTSTQSNISHSHHFLVPAPALPSNRLPSYLFSLPHSHWVIMCVLRRFLISSVPSTPPNPVSQAFASSQATSTLDSCCFGSAPVSFGGKRLLRRQFRQVRWTGGQVPGCWCLWYGPFSTCASECQGGSCPVPPPRQNSYLNTSKKRSSVTDPTA